MKDLLREIRSQPQWTRELLFGFCVISTVSLVGMIWYGSFQQDMYALLHTPEEVDRYFAQSRSSGGILALIDKGIDSTKAGIYSLLNINFEDSQTSINSSEQRVYPMPLSEDRTE